MPWEDELKPEDLLERLRQGELANVSWSDLERLLGALGFRLDRVRGSHLVYRHEGHGLRIVLQARRGEAKPYQLRQLLQLVRVYNLGLGEGR